MRYSPLIVTLMFVAGIFVGRAFCIEDKHKAKVNLIVGLFFLILQAVIRIFIS